MIGVVHTFGRNVGFNPHIHALVTEIKTRVEKLRINLVYAKNKLEKGNQKNELQRMNDY